MSKKEPVITLAEWIVAAIGGLFVAAAIVFLALSAYRQGTPASFSFDVDSIYRVQGGFAVRVEAHNSGTETASQLTIEATLEDAEGRSTERSTFTFDYLPGRSMRGGVLFFTQDPARGRVALRAVGYEEP